MTMYQQGTYFERLTKNWLINKGYYVMRSAGSKGKGDLCVFPLKESIDVGLNHIHPFVIQLKSGDVSYFEDNELIELPHYFAVQVKSFAELKFNNAYVDKYLFIYDKTKKIKEPFIYKWVIFKWMLVMEGSNEESKE